MDRHPEHVFACSQAQQYAWIEGRLSRAVRPHQGQGRGGPVRPGRIDVGRGRRQHSVGRVARPAVRARQAVLRGRVRRRRRTEVWIPDVFGYSGQLPQIMAPAGCRALPDPEAVVERDQPLPASHLLVGGHRRHRRSSPTSRRPTPTTATFRANELVHAERNYAEHGFGQPERSIRSATATAAAARPPRCWSGPRQADLEGLPRVDLEAPEAFFTEAHAEYPDAPVWRGELYFEMHRGTYTSPGRRPSGATGRASWLLREAELWSAVAARGDEGLAYPADDLDRLWKVLLLHQFHDIIPGSLDRMGPPGHRGRSRGVAR